MNNFQFRKLVKDIPSIDVSLNWLGSLGHGTFEREFISNSFTVLISFDCLETGIHCGGDYLTPASFISDGLDVLDLEFDVYNEDGDSVNLSQNQRESLSEEIKFSIISN